MHFFHSNWKKDHSKTQCSWWILLTVQKRLGYYILPPYWPQQNETSLIHQIQDRYYQPVPLWRSKYDGRTCPTRLSSMQTWGEGCGPHPPSLKRNYGGTEHWNRQQALSRIWNPRLIEWWSQKKKKKKKNADVCGKCHNILINVTNTNIRI